MIAGRAGEPMRLLHQSLCTSTPMAHSTLSHVKAHTDGVDAHSVGNRLSDYQANLSRSRPDRSSPVNLAQLPLAKCEHHLVITNGAGLVIADDIRRAAMNSKLLSWSTGAASQATSRKGHSQARP